VKQIAAFVNFAPKILDQKGLTALASRLGVYVLGLAALFLMATKIPPALFGKYSIYQSILELGLIFASLGSSILFARGASHEPPSLHSGDVRQTLIIGLPLAGIVTVTTLVFQNEHLNALPIALFLGTLLVFAFNTLHLAYARGRGASGLLNSESGIRSIVLLCGVGLLLTSGTKIGISTLLTINLFAALAITAAIHASAKNIPCRGPATLRLPEQCGAAFYSLMMFSLRKADLLIIAFFMPLPYVAAYKLAFVLAEAPSQFVQAYLYTRTVKMLDFKQATQSPKLRLELAKYSFALGTFLFVGMTVVVYACADIVNFGKEAKTIFLSMLPYFLLRTYTVHNEMLLQLHVGMRRLGCWAVVELTLKTLSYLCCFYFFPESPHYVFFLAFVYEFFLLEIRMKMAWGHFPILLLFGYLA
jgi:O-antigen/teichoic acid export membrane protein